MYLDYDALINESAQHLLQLERQHRHSPIRPRIQMLRLLKTGTARSRRALAATLGFSERQLHRWFETYRKNGLQALLNYQAPPGAKERITPQALEALDKAMKTGRIATLKQAQAFLSKHYRIHYTVGGLSDLFKRYKIKLKTGRLRHDANVM